MSGPTFGEIKAELEARIRDLVQELAPGGHFDGGYYFALNPTRADRSIGSFWIRVLPPVGVWKDHATDDTGDVVKLIQYVERLPDYSATREWCLEWLGWGGKRQGRPAPNPARIEADRRKREEEAKKAAAAAELSTDDKRKRAFGLWLGAQDMTRQQPAIVRRYLASRGLEIERMPAAVRFYERHDYRLHDGGTISRPCLVSLLSGPNGRPVGIHRTWLKPDGSGKAVFPDPKSDKPRKIWPGGWQGGVIRLAKGESAMSPEEAVRHGLLDTLVVVEGLEDGIAVMIACPAYRVWAAGTLGNLRYVPMLDCIETVIVCADNDWGKPQAAAELDAAIEILRATGRRVAVARSWRGKDVNDLMMGREIA